MAKKKEVKKQKKEFKISQSTIVIISLFIGIFLGYLLTPQTSVSNMEENTPIDDNHSHDSLKVSCENFNGIWLEESQECEGIDKNSCNEMEGKFNECASACRNDPNAQMCTMQCVLVCDLSNHHDEREHEMDMKHDHSMHMHEKFEVTNDLIPNVKVKVTKDLKSGYNLELETTNFIFSPDGASGEHVENHGHAHLYINDKKITRLYSNDYFLGSLENGENLIRVTLNTNDHKDYSFNNQVIKDSTIILVE